MPKIKILSLLSFLIAALTFTTFQSIHAEESGSPETEQQAPSKAPVIEIPTTVVTGSRERVDAPGKLPVPVQIITKEEIEAIGAITLGEALELFQGVELVTSPDLNISPGFQTLRIRGMDIAHCLVLVDGRRLPGSFPTQGGYSYTDVSIVSVDMIERIEVLRDGASAQYGSDAVAGVINIITKKYHEGVSLNTQYGTSSRSDGTQRHVDGLAGFAGGPLYVTVGGFRKEIDHYDRTRGISWDSADYAQKGTNAKIGFDISDRQFLALDFRYMDSDSDLRKDLNVYRVTDKKLHDTALSWEGEFNPWTFYLGSYLGKQDLNRRKSEEPEYSGDIDTDKEQHDATAFWKATPWLSLFTGASWREEKIDSGQRNFDETRRLKAVFAEAILRPFEGFKVYVSGRYEDYSDFGDDFAPKLAARYEILPSLAVRASISESFKVPTLYQLHDTYTGCMGWLDMYGNPDVEPAEGLNTTAGAVWKIRDESRTSLTIDYFHNDIDELIEFEMTKERTATENAEGEYINLHGTSTFQGGEMSFSTDLVYGFGFDLMANMLWARDPDDNDLTNRPRSGLRAVLRYRYRDRFWGNFRYKYRGKYISDLNEKIEYFDTIAAQINLAITDNITFYLGGRNLLDEDPPIDIEKYVSGHKQGPIDSTMGAFWYTGLRLKF